MNGLGCVGARGRGGMVVRRAWWPGGVVVSGMVARGCGSSCEMGRHKDRVRELPGRTAASISYLIMDGIALCSTICRERGAICVMGKG